MDSKQKKLRRTGAELWGKLELPDSWRPRVMVVDDSRLRRAFIENWLKANRFVTIEQFEDGQAAIDHLMQAEGEALPELLLTDMEMPRLGGLELIRRLRKEARFDAVEVIPYTMNLHAALSGELTDDPDSAELTALAKARGYPELVLRVEQLPLAVIHRVGRLLERRSNGATSATA